MVGRGYSITTSVTTGGVFTILDEEVVVAAGDERGVRGLTGNDQGGSRNPSLGSDCSLNTVSVDSNTKPSATYKLYPTLTAGEVWWTGPVGGPYQVADT